MRTPQDYKTLLEKTAIYAKMGSWEVDIKKNKIFWSDVTKSIHEVSKDYSPNIETAFNFFEDPYSKNLVRKSFEKAISRGETYDIKIKITTAKKNEIWVRSIGIPVIENEECISVYGLFQNIDEEERKNQELHTQLQFVNDVFLNSSIGIVVSDINGNIQKSNKGFSKLIGYSPNELTKITFRDFTHPKDLEKSVIGFQKLINGEISTFTTQKRYIKKDKKISYVYLVLSAIKDKDNNPFQVLAQIVDLSEQYETKQKLESYLNITTDQNQRLLNFAHIVSHNLKSHYGNLKMLLDLLKIENDELENNEILPLLSQSVNSLGETIQHLNEVVLVQTSDRKNFKSLNLSNYIYKCIESLSALIKIEKVNLNFDLDDTIFINAIPAYIESILLNLITNAIKYRSHDRAINVNVLTFVQENFVILKVEDNGLGIDLELNRSKLFGMYKTFHNHKDSRGIGLFITKNQIEALGGSIEVESEVNKGTVFLVKFLKK